MKPARKVSDDGFPARPEGEEARFAAQKLDAEGRRVSRPSEQGAAVTFEQYLARLMPTIRPRICCNVVSGYYLGISAHHPAASGQHVEDYLAWNLAD
jgi:hypothetical protein